MSFLIHFPVIHSVVLSYFPAVVKWKSAPIYSKGSEACSRQCAIQITTYESEIKLKCHELNNSISKRLNYNVFVTHIAYKNTEK